MLLVLTLTAIVYRAGEADRPIVAHALNWEVDLHGIHRPPPLPVFNPRNNGHRLRRFVYERQQRYRVPLTFPLRFLLWD